MNRLKRIILIAFLIVVVVTFFDNSAVYSTKAVQAATVKLSVTDLAMTVGQVKIIKLNSKSKKVTWTSSKTAVATVSSKGKVTAVAVGEAKIMAKIVNKSYIYNVTVRKANPYLKEAPFQAEETNVDDINFIIPSEWNIYSQILGNGYTYTEITAPKESGNNSILRIDIRKQEGTPSDYEILKEAFKNNYTKETLTPQWKEVFGDSKIELSELKQSDFSAPYNKVLRTQYTVTSGGLVVEETIYDFFIGDYLISFTAEDYDQIKLADLTDYMVSSFVVQ